MTERRITVESSEHMQEICGSFDENIRALEKQYNVSVVCRGGEIKIVGEGNAVAHAESALLAMLHMSETGQTVDVQTVRYVSAMVDEGEAGEIDDLTEGDVCLTATGKVVRAKTVGQKRYVDAIKKNTIVFGIGPAGTGKTYLAVAMAVKAFKRHDVSRIILTRPAVEAGEKLGFLPGDLQNKVDPYLRPLYDALFEMLGAESFQRHMERGSIEVAPLAYMRGRTLDNAFIILDEAQNTTSEQLKMFLTRLGEQSRMVITGDVTQIDLPDKRKCGLLEAMKVLRRVEEISIQEFTNKDVVRHRLVQDIIKAYEKYYHGKGENDACNKSKGCS
ncbi:MAG: PhoH family protein [Ruminococcus sp.]|nr:PhoH family protein [Ruminococcus sp.]